MSTVLNLKGKPISEVTTTAGERFTAAESVELARLVLKRFGGDKTAAAAAWRRLLQNGCPDDDFEALAGAVLVPGPFDPGFQYIGGSAVGRNMLPCETCGHTSPCYCVLPPIDQLLGGSR